MNRALADILSSMQVITLESGTFIGIAAGDGFRTVKVPADMVSNALAWKEAKEAYLAELNVIPQLPGAA